MVMQDVNHQLFTENVLDELLLSIEGDDENKNTERAKQILSSLDLADKIKLHLMSLSGGEKQRVAIGSAIASNKEALVYDEPTSGFCGRDFQGGKMHAVTTIAGIVPDDGANSMVSAQSVTVCPAVPLMPVQNHRPLYRFHNP